MKLPSDVDFLRVIRLRKSPLSVREHLYVRVSSQPFLGSIGEHGKVNWLRCYNWVPIYFDYIPYPPIQFLDRLDLKVHFGFVVVLC